MPTGYTSAIYEGKDVSAKEFISKCARAFGAYVMVRDEPLDSNVPDEFLPSTYQREKLEEAKLNLKNIQNMTLEEAKDQLEKEHHITLERNNKSREENQQLYSRYLDLLAKVKELQPPSVEHQELKEFCIQQLKDSIKWDCGHTPSDPTMPSVEVWLDNKIEQCLKDIEYHSKEWAAEIKRVSERNKWIKQLKDSLENFG